MYEDIDSHQNQLLFGLRESAESALKTWHKNKDGKSTEDNNIFTFNKKELDEIESILYKAKSKDLTDQFSREWHRQYAKEIESKREILNML